MGWLIIVLLSGITRGLVCLHLLFRVWFSDMLFLFDFIFGCDVLCYLCFVMFICVLKLFGVIG